jgi:hypothetical protein
MARTLTNRPEAATMNRVGSGLLAFVGFVLAALMVYSLAPEGGWSKIRPDRSSDQGVDEVTVFFPDRPYWVDFRQGVEACRARGLLRTLEDVDDTIVVSTPRHSRTVRFSLHDVRGARDTMDEVRRLVGRTAGPVAVVGSSNTVMTTALAVAMRDAAAREGRPAPVLLVPWATTVLVDPSELPEGGRSDQEDGPMPLLALARGRTFRFSPNNQVQAELVTHCLIDHDPGSEPRRVDLVVDRNDPYSVDLADLFHRIIERRFRNVELVEHADQVVFPGTNATPGMPGPLEDALAESICRAAGPSTSAHATWVVLPLQKEPARRMLLALRRHARRLPRGVDGGLRVLCGDGLAMADLAEVAGDCPFPVWCFSPLSLPAEDPGPAAVEGTDGQICAEIVSALVRCLDVAPGRVVTSDSLRDALAVLRLAPPDPAAFGRSLSFAPTGERQGIDVGHVLMIRPGERTVFAFSKTSKGRWGEPVPVRAVPAAGRP